MYITSPEKFAAEFNQKVPGAYRKITAGDVRLLTDSGLIKHYGYYSQTDFLTITGILQYERLREKEIGKAKNSTAKGKLCKYCGAQLVLEEVVKKGRHKEYCRNCEPLRSKLRNCKWRDKRLLETKSHMHNQSLVC